MEVVIDNRAELIPANVAAALGSVTIKGAKAFETVGLYDDLEAFRRIGANALGKVSAGVIVQVGEKELGMDSHEYAHRISMEVAVAFSCDRGAGQPPALATMEMQRYAEIVRVALYADKSRGGMANMVKFGARLINGTWAEGKPRLVNPGPNQAFWMAVIPVDAGYTTDRP